MSDFETNLDTSDLYHSALDTLMNSLKINSTSSSNTPRCNNSFQRDFNSADEGKFFSFCSTIKQRSKSDRREKVENDDASETHTQNVVTDSTPKRSVITTRKQKLFESTETIEEFKPKLSENQLSPKSLLLKKAMTRLESLERQQERIALNKKTVRTSLRI